MPCYYPLKAYRSAELHPRTGRSLIVFRSNAGGYHDVAFELPCGRCIGCRLDLAQQWALRCVHEAQCHEANCFLTLTYDEQHLPPGGVLVKAHAQQFIKRLRERVRGRSEAKSAARIKVMYSGEYGSKSNRPHYHVLVFGFDFPDRKYLKKSPSGYPLYTSDLLNSLWPLGNSSTADLSFQSAAYVARYTLKKMVGLKDGKDYCRVNYDKEFNRWYPVPSEFAHMSNGIGADWYSRFSSDVFPHDYCVWEGRKVKVPRYYTELLKEGDPLSAGLVRGARKRGAEKFADDQTPRRRRVRALVRDAKVSTFLRREFDGET